MAMWQRFRSPQWEVVARTIDARYHLKDRVITAWALAQQHEPTGLERLQVRDALSHLRQIEPAAVAPWQTPPRLWWAVAIWLVAVTLGSVPPLTAETQTELAAQQQQDAVNRQTAEVIEETLVRDMQRLADSTSASHAQWKSLQALPRQIQQQLNQLKQSGRTQRDTLATLSEIQAAIAEASRQLSDETILAQLQQLGQAFSSVDSLQKVAEQLKLRDFANAAEQLRQLDPQDISQLERQTLAEELKPLIERMQQAGAKSLAVAVEPLQQGLERQDGQLIVSAADQLATALQEQALRLAIQAQLNAQLGQLSEAKGVSQSGGNNVAQSDESRETWGRGRAGDPLSGQSDDLQTTRRREELTGVRGDGPSSRQTTLVQAAEGQAQRSLQTKFRPYEQSAEDVLRKEPLPLGYRQTIRRYFRSIRPE
jgi:hypothetical protein